MIARKDIADFILILGKIQLGNMDSEI